jgi:hypothetical protein
MDLIVVPTLAMERKEAGTRDRGWKRSILGIIITTEE